MVHFSGIEQELFVSERLGRCPLCIQPLCLAQLLAGWWPGQRLHLTSIDPCVSLEFEGRA